MKKVNNNGLFTQKKLKNVNNNGLFTKKKCYQSNLFEAKHFANQTTRRSRWRKKMPVAFLKMVNDNGSSTRKKKL